MQSGQKFIATTDLSTALNIVQRSFSAYNNSAVHRPHSLSRLSVYPSVSKLMPARVCFVFVFVLHLAALPATSMRDKVQVMKRIQQKPSTPSHPQKELDLL
jgi:hypothetical protein